MCAELDGGHDDGSSCGVRVVARVVALLLICVIAGLAPAAYADPPDPSWIDGFWDNDDYDNVVVMVLHAHAIVEPFSPDAGPVWAAVAFVECRESHATAAPVDVTACPRAPPLLSSL